MKILIIDDDKKLCRLVQEYLEPVGFQVSAAHSGAEGLALVRQENFDALILDVMMPGMDGLDVLRQLRQVSNVPVLMFTARGDEMDRIVGLEMGADDYIPKTFSSRELLARLRAVIRRSAMASEPVVSDKKQTQDQIIIQNLIIIPHARSILQDMTKLDLTPVEYDLLVSLACSAGRILSRDQLLESVSGRDYTVFDRSIDVHISSLRRKLGDDPKNPRYIKTIRSAGYMFLDEEG